MSLDPITESDQPLGRAVPGVVLWILRFMALMGIGLAIRLYLKHWSAHGCAECAGVISGEWGHVMRVPVSVLAGILYTLIFMVLMLPMRRMEFHQAGRFWFILSIFGVMIAGSAVWFIYLQWIKLHSRWCNTCLLEHAVGILFALVIWTFSIRAGALREKRIPLGLAIGLGAVGFMVLVQGMTHADYLGPQALVGTYDSMGNYREKGDTTVSLQQDLVRLNPESHLLLGPHDAGRISVAVIDYTCPKCARLEALLRTIQPQLGSGYATVVLLYPLNPACNEKIEELEPRHRDACDLARLAYAVWTVNPDRFTEFHRWLFENQGRIDAAAAHEHAALLVGQVALNEALSGDAMAKLVHRDVEIAKLLSLSSTPGLFVGKSKFDIIPEEATDLYEWIVKAFDKADAAGARPKP